MSFVLDTHVLLWWLAGDRHLGRAQRRAIDAATAERPLVLSDISLWEIAILHRLGGLDLDRPLREWLEQAAAPPLVRRQGISPAIAAEAASLPDSFPRDPADRIIAATARVLGATLLTSDRRIAASGVVRTQS